MTWSPEGLQKAEKDGPLTESVLFLFDLEPHSHVWMRACLCTGRMNAPNLELLPLVRMTPRLICGRNEPVQGWLAIGGQDVPAPVAVYKRRTRLPFRTGYVIYPFGADRVTAGITTKTIRRANVWTVSIAHAGGGRDRVRMDWEDERGPVLLR